MRSLKRKARKENQSQIRKPNCSDTLTDALENTKTDEKNRLQTEIKSETKNVKSRDEQGQASKQHSNKKNEASKKENDISRTNEWVEEMNKINFQKSLPKKKETKIEMQKQLVTSSNDASSSSEFSPIVYWREPIPDVEILCGDPSNNAENVDKTKSSPKTEDELRRCLSLDKKSFWLEKSKYDDAEAKHHEAKRTSINERKGEEKTKSKTNGATKTKEDYEIDYYGDKTLEDVLEDFRCDNDRFRTQIIGLTKIIENLQIRIGNLESIPAAEVNEFTCSFSISAKIFFIFFRHTEKDRQSQTKESTCLN